MPFKKVISFCSLLLLLLLFAGNSSASVCPHNTASFKKASVSVITHGIPGSVDRIELPVPTTVLGIHAHHHSGTRNDLNGDLHEAYLSLEDCTRAQLALLTLQRLQFYTPTQLLLLFPKHWFW